MTGAIYVLEIIAIGLAWPLARQRPEHRPVAVLLSIGLASDVGRRLLRVLYLGAAIQRLGVDTPWPWPERAAGHLSDALVLAWPAAMVGAALVAFLHRRAWPAVVAYVATVGALIVTHPIAGDGSLGRALTAAQVAAVMVATGCALTWSMRSRERTTSAQACMLIVTFGEIGSLFGSWRVGVFADWHLTQIAYVVMYVVIILIQGGYLWLTPSTSRRSSS